MHKINFIYLYYIKIRKLSSSARRIYTSRCMNKTCYTDNFSKQTVYLLLNNLTIINKSAITKHSKLFWSIDFSN